MRIGIIGAMELEITALQAQLSYLRVEKYKNYIFYIGQYAENEVILMQSGIGKVAATVATSLLIEKYMPEQIINTGTAGGLKHVMQGDLVIATHCKYHDADVTAFGYKLGQMAGQPEFFESNQAILNNLSICIETLYVKQSLHLGEILSGDSFMHDIQRVKTIKELFPNALAIDMESAAIAQSCYQLQIPFVAIRAISDMAGEGDASSYEKFVNEAGKLTASIILAYIKNL